MLHLLIDKLKRIGRSRKDRVGGEVSRDFFVLRIVERRMSIDLVGVEVPWT